MITIRLDNLQFKAFHGIHEAEKILGNLYILDAAVEIQEELKVIHSIHNTVNYEDMYNIIRERMNVPTSLLETIIMDIGNEFHKEFPEIRTINISIKKLNPPIEGMQGQASVCWRKDF
jgi:7,8-dihydroneopterin aldolase/epimerase/oxygenase